MKKWFIIQYCIVLSISVAGNNNNQYAESKNTGYCIEAVISSPSLPDSVKIHTVDTLSMYSADILKNAIKISVCSGAGFTYGKGASNNSLTTYSWGLPALRSGLAGGRSGVSEHSVNGTLFNNTTDPVTALYTVTPTSGKGTGKAFPVIVTVYPTPITFGQSASACSGVAFSYSPSGSHIPSGTSYMWSVPAVDTGITGGAAARGQTSVIGTLVNTKTGIKLARYSVTPTAGSCRGVPFIVTVTVNAAKGIELASPAGSDKQTICGNRPLSQKIVYTLSDLTPTAKVSGLPLGMGYDLSGYTLTISGTPTESGTFHYTVTAIGTVCTPNTAQGTLTVLEQPKAIINIAACNNKPFLYPAPAGTKYSWSAPTLGTGLSGGAAAKGQTSFNGILSNKTNQAATATYTVRSSLCDSAETSFVAFVTVNPTIPDIKSQSTNAHSGVAFSYSPEGAQAGTTYSWSGPLLGPGLTGGAAGKEQSALTNTLTNTTAGAVTAAYSVTPTTNGCTGNKFTVTVKVKQ